MDTPTTAAGATWPPPLPFKPRRILRIDTVEARVGLRRSAIYLEVAAGRFPAPRSLTPSGRATGWDESEIDAWIEALPHATVPAGVSRWRPPPPTAAVSSNTPPEKPRTLSRNGRIVGRPRKTDRLMQEPA